MTAVPFDDLAALLQGWLWAGFLVFLRVGAVIGLAPAFGEMAVPVRVRLAVAAAFTVVVLPAVAGSLPPRPGSFVAAVGPAAAEVLTGLFFGILVRFFVFALQTAGTIAAQSTSLAQLFGAGASVEPAPAVGHLLVIGGLALAALLGLHVRLAAYLMESYALVAAGRLPAPGTMIEAGLAQLARTFAMAFTLAAPFVIAALLYNLLLGVINRAMPQLMVTFIGAPALTAGGLVLILLAMPAMLAVWSDALAGFLAVPFGDTP